MVVCKYFQQGNCRFGQYCRFEHTSNFGVPQGTGNKSYGDNKSIVLGVAEEALAAERGGQWLLSCFGPFKEQTSIPGMEDVSPEEVRWEMYQAKKNDTVEKTKLQFEQLCQIMTKKRDALKNPTQETVAMLEQLQKLQKNPSLGLKSNPTLFNPQFSGTTVGSGIFISQKFGSPLSGSFGEGFNSTPNSQVSIFTRPTSSNASVLGVKSSFGTFEPQKASNAIFEGTSVKTITGAFGVGHSMSPFSSTASSVTTPTETTVVAQPTAPSSFGVGNNEIFLNKPQQQNNIFSNNQSTSVFSDQTVSNKSPYSNPYNSSTVSSFHNGNPGGNLFSNTVSIQSTGALIFGGTSVNSTKGSSIFGKSNVNAGLGGTLMFPGSGTGFGMGATTGFGDPSVFCNDGNIFGSNNCVVSAPLNQNTFASVQNPITYENTVAPTSEDKSLLVSSITTTSASLGSSFRSSPGTTCVTGLVKSNVPVILGNISEFSTIIPKNHDSSTALNSTFANTTINNPFHEKIQETVSEPGNAFKAQVFAESFRQSLLPSTNNNPNIDPSLYSTEKDLSGNERTMFLAEFFSLAKIPINPPTIELR